MAEQSEEADEAGLSRIVLSVKPRKQETLPAATKGSGRRRDGLHAQGLSFLQFGTELRKALSLALALPQLGCLFLDGFPVLISLSPCGKY